MSDLLKGTPAACEWRDAALRRHSGGIFGQVVSSVIWSDARNADGKLLVDVNPEVLAARVNERPFIVLHNHDPGKPVGYLLEAKSFETSNGRQFVAAVLGYYAGGAALNFRELGIDLKVFPRPPEVLPPLPEGLWIQMASDPKEVDGVWLADAISGAPLRIEYSRLSHNAAGSEQELIKIGVAFLILVWNPFVKSFANEAGKDAYARINQWLRRFLERLKERRKPILELFAHQEGCQVSFLFRGKEVKRHHAALDALPRGAAQAAQLIANLEARGMSAQRLIYEYDSETPAWFPSYAILHDKRIIIDEAMLIAIERLPTGLSLGLSDAESFSPVIKPVARDD